MRSLFEFVGISVSSLQTRAGKPAKAILSKLGLLPRHTNLWEKYKSLRRAFQANPNEQTAQALQELIGTTSSFRDIEAAMNAEFDLQFYLSSNPDVRSHTKDGDIHYLLWGWKEGRNPSKFFDHGYYLQQNKSIAEREFPLAHFVMNGKKSGEIANAISDKLWFSPYVPDEAAWASVEAAKRTPRTRAVVIIPVYKGYEETLTSIYHALSSRAGQCYSLLIINDNSPDERLTAKLSQLANSNLFDYFESDINRGFVQSINYALRHLSHDLDVVLLNSDAYVFTGWFDRLIKHADLDARIATITPLSNNATICSYPRINHDNYHALEIAPQLLDQLAAQSNSGLSVEAPTGVGFCFYVRRSVIDTIGMLDDSTFKVGYGEENDFCMRALNAGYRNIIAGDVFVYHTGSVSFSSTKDENLARGQAALEYKHPNYTRLIRNHIAADPELHMRRNLDATRLALSSAGCTLFITHKWSGGIDTYLEHTQKILRSRGKKCVVLRVHDVNFATVEVPGDGELFVPNLTDIDLRTEWKFLLRLIRDLSPEVFHVNSFAGLSWEWHKQFLEAIVFAKCPITFIGHDYSPISHHYQLIRPDNVFAGLPDLTALRQWSLMTDHSGSVDACDPKERLDVYARFFQSVRNVEVPSAAAREVYQQAFPFLKINVVPHDDHLPDTTIAVRRQVDGITRIAVVGAIGPHKGSDVLAGLVADAKNKELPIEYHLIGYSNIDDYLVSQGMIVWGRYAAETDAMDLLDRIKPDLLLIPSIWPETFCYTLSMALKKRIPPVVFSIGAQEERVSEIDWGVVLPINLASNPTALSNQLLSISIGDLWNSENRATQQ
ncbi:glycosyltransferase [Ensifer sp. Root127]|uniref:glycosyltransferase n=1 Tax=Ensifer sp. Root127 TaxID=1736440 RepID=UPI0007107035|nr:glycosyltransferase [Ensifer sp. Root127]KQW72498.1 hypothetical protein ASD03_30890 [Ensifer sp. Root127]